MAEKRYYSTADIMEILGVGKKKAIEIMRMFDDKGKMLDLGERTLRVRITYFEEWLDRQDGEAKRKKVLDRQFQRTNSRRG